METEPETEPDVNDYVEEDTIDGTDEEVSVVETNSQFHMSGLINGTQPHEQQTQSQTRTMSDCMTHDSMTQNMTHTMNDSASHKSGELVTDEDVTVMADDEMEETTQEAEEATTATESIATTSHSPPEKRARPNAELSSPAGLIRTGSHVSNIHLRSTELEDEFEISIESEPEIKSSSITFSDLFMTL